LWYFLISIILNINIIIKYF